MSLSGTKMFLRMAFSPGADGLIFEGVTYDATEAGLKALAYAVAPRAMSEVLIIQSGFEGGYSTGQANCTGEALLTAIMELLVEFGYLDEIVGVRQIMTHADWSQFCANT